MKHKYFILIITACFSCNNNCNDNKVLNSIDTCFSRFKEISLFSENFIYGNIYTYLHPKNILMYDTLNNLFSEYENRIEQYKKVIRKNQFQKEQFDSIIDQTEKIYSIFNNTLIRNNELPLKYSLTYKYTPNQYDMYFSLIDLQTSSIFFKLTYLKELYSLQCEGDTLSSYVVYSSIQ